MADRILHLVYVLKVAVCQPDFLAHVDERCPESHVHHRCEHRGRFIAVSLHIDREAVHTAGIVVVFQYQRVPALPVRRPLRIKQAFLELAQVKRLGKEFLAADIIRVKMAEAEDRVQFAIALPHIFPRVFRGRMEGLSYCQNIVKGK